MKRYRIISLVLGGLAVLGLVLGLGGVTGPWSPSSYWIAGVLATVSIPAVVLVLIGLMVVATIAAHLADRADAKRERDADR